MPIQLSQEERALLEQFVRPYKPTKRQKALVLLGLAAGQTPEAVAVHVGIPKDAVTELANHFAERGLAGVGLGKKPEIEVTLVRAGLARQRYRLPVGSTLADLLERSGAMTGGQTVRLDDAIPEEPLVLHDKAIVTIIPATENAAGAGTHQLSVPSLRDDSIFEEFRDILKARRQALTQEEGSEE
jgi:hypothetical protein